jgi:uncharacterized membrane protein YidH (DUF202 family)
VNADGGRTPAGGGGRAAGGGPGEGGGRAAGGEPSGRRVVDEGLQGERTALAWDRTALTTLAVGALLARAGGTVLPWAWIAAAVVVAAGGVGLLLGRTRYVRRDASIRGEAVAPSTTLIAVAGAVAVTVSLLSFAVVVGVATRTA